MIPNVTWTIPRVLYSVLMELDFESVHHRFGILS